MMKRWPLIIIIVLTVGFAAFFSWFSLGRHWKTNSGRFDLGNIEQVVWNTTHGNGFTLTDPYGTSNVSRLAFHADLLLIPIAGIYAVFPWTEALLLVQVLAVASGIWGVYVLGKRLLGTDWWGALAAGVYALTPGIQWALIFDVHAVTFVTPLIIWAIVAVQARRWWAALILVVVAMTAKEEIGLMLPAIGLYALFVQRVRVWGVVLTAIPFVWSVAMFLLVLPAVHQASGTTGEVYQTVFGNGALSVIRGALFHPLTFGHALLAKQNLVYAWQLLVSGGLVSVFSGWWLAALPEFIINALSLKPAQHLIISHYTSGITPWLLVSTIFSLAWLKRRLMSTFRLSPKAVGLGLSAVVLASSLFGAWWLSPLPWTPHDQTKFVTWANPYAQPVRQWAERIPAAAAVSVTNDVGSQFARRQYLYSFPFGVDRATYIVVLERHATPVVATDDEVSSRIVELRADSAWRVLEHRGDLTVLQRIP